MPPPPRRPAPDAGTIKAPAHQPKSAPSEEAFIGHEAKTLVNIDVKALRAEHEAQQRPAAKAPPPRAAAPAARPAPKAPPPAKPARRASRPVDSDGVEWDWVTNEGIGFNDTDGEEEMSFQRNGKTYFKPDFGDWDTSDWVGYWTKHFALEAAQGESEEAFDAAIAEAGLRNRKHLERVRTTFMKHYGSDPEFTNAAVVARQEQARGMMRNAVKPGGMDPIEGVSLQLFAAISAQRASLDAAGFKKLLAQHKLDEARFARADAGWMARMSDQSDPMAAMAVATEYGKAFAGAGSGQFGASAQAASGSMGINDKVAGKNVKGKEPMPFERYVEISAAQSAWAQQGKDVNALLKKTFNLTAVDFSNVSAYWAQKMSTDVKLMPQVYPPLEQKYRERYSAPDADGDLDV
jgi:hypothetical protein